MEGQIDLKHMKKAEKKTALLLAVVTSLMGEMSVKVASATYHIAETMVQVWKRLWWEDKLFRHPKVAYAADNNHSLPE